MYRRKDLRAAYKKWLDVVDMKSKAYVTTPDDRDEDGLMSFASSSSDKFDGFSILSSSIKGGVEVVYEDGSNTNTSTVEQNTLQPASHHDTKNKVKSFK